MRPSRDRSSKWRPPLSLITYRNREHAYLHADRDCDLVGYFPLLCFSIPSTFSIILVPVRSKYAFFLYARETGYSSYIFFPRSSSVAFPSSLSSASSMRPMCPRSVPSSSSYFRNVSGAACDGGCLLLCAHQPFTPTPNLPCIRVAQFGNYLRLLLTQTYASMSLSSGRCAGCTIFWFERWRL